MACMRVTKVWARSLEPGGVVREMDQGRRGWRPWSRKMEGVAGGGVDGVVVCKLQEREVLEPVGEVNGYVRTHHLFDGDVSTFGVAVCVGVEVSGEGELVAKSLLPRRCCRERQTLPVKRGSRYETKVVGMPER